jgi:SAM-dependent methyltransferase
VLDVGVGLGRLLGPLGEYKRYGMDISLDYLKIAQERGVTVAMAKIEDMPYCKDFFDAVVITDVLEHVIDLAMCCRNIINVLRPGGVLIIRVPFKEDLSPYVREDLPYEYIHLRNFDEYSLRLLFSKIYKFQFLEANTVAPYLQGTPRFKVQLLPQNIIHQIREIIVDSPGLDFLSSVLNLSAEEFQDHIYSLRDVDPISFRKVVNLLVNGIEINAVFKKP